MLIGVILVFIILFMSRKPSFLLFFITFLVLSLVSAFRVNVGNDYDIYEKFFQGGLPVSGVEFSFIFITQLISQLSSDGRLGFIVFSFWTVFGYLYFIRKFSSNYFISIMMFIGLPIFFINSFNLMRQHFVIASFLFSLNYFVNNKNFVFVVVNCVSGFLHTSGFLYLSLYLRKLIPSYLQLYLSFALISLSFILIISLEKYVMPDSLSYYSTHSSENNFPLLLVLTALMFLFSIVNYIFKKTFTNSLLLQFCFVSFLCLISTFFSEYNMFWLRIAQLFFPSYLLVLPIFVNYLSSNNILKFLIERFIMIFFMFIFVIKYIKDPSFGFNV